MPYKVIAPCVIAQDENGFSHHYYGPGGNDPGATIHWLSDEQAEHFLNEGLVEKVGSTSDDGPPAKTAPKGDWVDYAISKGADPAEAEESTKQELQDLYGG